MKLKPILRKSGEPDMWKRKKIFFKKKKKHLFVFIVTRVKGLGIDYRNKESGPGI